MGMMMMVMMFIKGCNHGTCRLHWAAINWSWRLPAYKGRGYLEGTGRNGVPKIFLAALVAIAGTENVW